MEEPLMRSAKCRCGSGRREHRCCGPILDGRPAPTPEALMRSRYAAYARGLVDHIVATTDPDGPQWQADAEAWRADITRFHERFRFPGVRILDAPAPRGDAATVTFHARLVAGGQDAGFTERSRFVRRDGRWLYHSGQPLPNG